MKKTFYFLEFIGSTVAVKKKEVKMSYTVTLYFDNMVDETHFFKKEGDAAKCKAQLESKYRGNRMYKVKLEELEE